MNDKENEIYMEFDAVSENERLARVVIAAFLARLDPTVEQLEDVKTAVSEAVTNAIIHGYEEKGGKVVMRASLSTEDMLEIHICDTGVGIGSGTFWDGIFVYGGIYGWCRGRELCWRRDKSTYVEIICRMCGSTAYITGGGVEQGWQVIAYGREAREALFHKNTGLVHHVVKRFLSRGLEAEDLFQIGSVGLLKAIDKFDPDYGVCFSTYAVPLIMGEIQRFLRDDGLIKVSRGIKENLHKLKTVREKLIQQMGREPTLSELAAETGLMTEDIVMAFEAGREVESIYKTMYETDDYSSFL